MAEQKNNLEIQPGLDELISPFLPIWDALPLGIAIYDKQGNIVFYNQAQSHIDNLPVDFALGNNVRFLYGPDPGPSLVIACLQSKKPIHNYVCVYRTVKGNAINSASWVLEVAARSHIVKS